MLSTVGTLESIGWSISNCSDLFVHLVVEMLDPRSRREWETAVSGTSEPPLYDALKTFLECRMRTLEALHLVKTEPTSSTAGKTKKQPKEKKEFTEAIQLCLNCFGKHQLADCQSKKTCAACSHFSTHDAYASGNAPTKTSTSLHV
ncbi:hypothetical protein RF55_6781 [Lasius niger]|uniref:Uncharacterized protein n=1 Tax=Lasius niger TaxID=67767 RepID=A0A0J7KRY9_LASNI|nr:hypothetical protein RF55_6781 [Lasius niger]